MRIIGDTLLERPVVQVELAGLELVETSAEFVLEARLDRTITTVAFELRLVILGERDLESQPIAFDDLFPVQSLPDAAVDVKDLYENWRRSEPCGGRL
jgi:hypothetical protein